MCDTRTSNNKHIYLLYPHQVGFIRRMRRDLQRRRAREGGASTSHGNQDGEGQYADRQGKGASRRPASAPTTTIGGRTIAVAACGTTGSSPEGKQRGGNEGRGGREGNEDRGGRRTQRFLRRR